MFQINFEVSMDEVKMEEVVHIRQVTFCKYVTAVLNNLLLPALHGFVVHSMHRICVFNE